MGWNILHRKKMFTWAYKLPMVIAAGSAGGTTMVIRSAASKKMAEADTLAKIWNLCRSRYS